ncbi:MAG: zf-HC2 domain-containing protein [Pyrinomonadaceae bacterium]|nr:zf-HC2 domain-containing protein [Pyrinomonadaceae bacterium]
MNANCFDIGMIQAFLDGELTHDESTRVSGHVATCDTCAVMLAEAEEESALVFPALEREFNTLVPTQRLWNKINDSIETERGNRSIWHKAWAFLAVALANPTFAAAASILIVIGISAAVLLNRAPEQPPVAAVVAPKTNVSSAVTNTPFGDVVVEPRSTAPYTVERASTRYDDRRVTASTAVYKTSTSTNNAGYMPGEESYVKTISSLSKTVETQKSETLRPSERIAYERDMAVVDDAIAKMRKEVRKNPRNESAKQVLYSSYQNKIDLLNSVSQKGELMASLR